MSTAPKVEVQKLIALPATIAKSDSIDSTDQYDGPDDDDHTRAAKARAAKVQAEASHSQASHSPVEQEGHQSPRPSSPSPSSPPNPQLAVGPSKLSAARPSLNETAKKLAATNPATTNGTGTAEVEVAERIPASKPDELDEEFEKELEEFKERKKDDEKENTVHLPGLVRSQKDGLLIVEMVADKDNKLLFATNKSKDLEYDLERGKDKTKVKIMPPLVLKSFVEPDPGGARPLRLPSKALRSFGIEKPPSEQQRANATVSLIGEIKAFIKRWADMPEEWITPIATYVLMTWVYDKFTVVPYLRFLGEPDTGKTRIAEVAAALSYRSLAVSGNITGASLFHLIDLIQGTVFLDEADYKNSDESSDIMKIINTGYKAGLRISRLESQGKKWVPRPFVVYGPKIITTRKRWDDAAAESRCLTFETQERKVPLHILLQANEKFESDALVLRNKLLGWRFDNFEHIKPDDSMLRKAGLKTRMAAMGTSLLAVAPESEKGAIVKFLKDYAEGAKGDSHREVVRQILEEAFAPQHPAGKEDVRDSFGVGEGDFDKEGNVPVARVTEITNQRLKGSGSNELTHKTIGGLVRSLGYLTRRKKTGYVVERRG